MTATIVGPTTASVEDSDQRERRDRGVVGQKEERGESAVGDHGARDHRDVQGAHAQDLVQPDRPIHDHPVVQQAIERPEDEEQRHVRRDEWRGPVCDLNRRGDPDEPAHPDRNRCGVGHFVEAGPVDQGNPPPPGRAPCVQHFRRPESRSRGAGYDATRQAPHKTIWSRGAREHLSHEFRQDWCFQPLSGADCPATRANVPPSPGGRIGHFVPLDWYFWTHERVERSAAGVTVPISTPRKQRRSPTASQ